jgi:hypothetical protein
MLDSSSAYDNFNGCSDSDTDNLPQSNSKIVNAEEDVEMSDSPSADDNSDECSNPQIETIRLTPLRET